MAQYIEVNGEPVEFPDDMSDAQIADVLKGVTAKQPMPSSSETALQIPTGGVQAPPAQIEAPSGFRQGLLDPFRGGSQLITKGMGALGSTWGAAEAQRMQESINAEEAAYQSQRKAAGQEGMDWARVAGNVLSPANIAALPAQAASKIYSILKAGGVSGAMEPVVSEEDTSFAAKKTQQIGTGVAGAVAGGAAAKAAAPVLNPLVSKAEQTMRDLGVTLTPGQLMGGQSKTLEEFASNMPLIGKYIANAKEKTLFDFNKGVINKALNKINDKLPENVIGRDAVQYANEIVDKKYDDVLSNIAFKLDFQAYSKILKAVQIPASPQDRTKVNDILNSVVYSKLPKGAAISGTLYKDIESDLRKKALSYSNSTLASEREIGDALFNALDGLKESLKKQNPTQTPALRRVDSAFGDLAVMKQAAANVNAENGVFTPKQYASAVRQRDLTRSKSKYAAGLARGQDVSDAALQILEKDVGSTLEGRLAMQTMGGWSLIQNPAMGAALAIASPVMYSDTGLKAMNTIMRSRPEIAKKIGKILTDRALKEGSITGAQVLEEYQRSLKTTED